MTQSSYNSGHLSIEYLYIYDGFSYQEVFLQLQFILLIPHNSTEKPVFIYIFLDYNHFFVTHLSVSVCACFSVCKNPGFEESQNSFCPSTKWVSHIKLISLGSVASTLTCYKFFGHNHCSSIFLQYYMGQRNKLIFRRDHIVKDDCNTYIYFY